MKASFPGSLQDRHKKIDIKFFLLGGSRIVYFHPDFSFYKYDKQNRHHCHMKKSITIDKKLLTNENLDAIIQLIYRDRLILSRNHFMKGEYVYGKKRF